MEREIGKYEWTSFQERTQKRNKFYLNDLPEYIEIQDWQKYMLDGLIDREEVYAAIRKHKKRVRPLF